MIFLGTVPFLLAGGLFGFSLPIGQRLPPALATWLLTLLALTAALTCGLVLSAAAVISLARLPQISHLGHWSPTVMAQGGAPPVWLGASIALVVVALLARSARRGIRSIRAVGQAHAALRGLGIADSGLVVLDGEAPTAYALGGGHGRIVVSTSMLRALSADERRVLFAHEAAHIRHHHYLFVQACELAAAANPLLHRTTLATRRSVERWADEAAAADVGDRHLTARSLARAALARSGSRALAGTLGGADGDVVPRVRALMAAPPAPRRGTSSALLLAAGCCWIATAAVALRAHALIELAQSIRTH